MHILMIGNSYTFCNEMPTILEAIAAANGKELAVESITKGGRKLIENVTGGDELAEKTAEAARSGHYDAVLLQEQTQREEDEEPQPEDPERSDSHDLWSLDPSKLEVSEEDIQAESGLRLSLEELMQQLMEEKKIPGRQTASRIKHLESIGMSYELADLVQYLQESINRDYDWFPGTRIRHGIVNYEFRTFPIPKAEILIDTSLSVDEELLKTFLRACKALLRGAAISVGCFDTRFYGFREIEQESDIDSMQFQGFGGTNFDVAVSAFTGDAENQIIFTDGYADMPHQRCDAIWIVYGNMKISPPGGTVLYIRERGFRERGYR